MKKIKELEKERILELHRNIPMKPYLPKIINEQLLPTPKKTGPTFSDQKTADEFRAWVHKNFPNVASTYKLDPPPSPWYQSKEIEKVLDYVDPKTGKTLEYLQLLDKIKNKQETTKKPDLLPLPKYQDRIIPEPPDLSQMTQFYDDKKTGIRTNLFTGQKYKQYGGKWIPIYDVDPFEDQAIMTARYGQTPGRKEYSPEEFKQYMKNQEKWDKILKSHPAHKIKYLKWDEMDSDQKHAFMMVTSIGAAFIPIIGFAISAGIELADANLYLNEGLNDEASVSILFSIISSLPVINKIKLIGNAGDSILSGLMKKLGVGGTKNFTAAELNLMKDVAKKLKTKEGLDNLWTANKIFKSAEAFNKFKTTFNAFAMGLGFTYGFAGTPLGNPIYALVGESLPEYMARQMLSLDLYVKIFYSDKSTKDNQLLFKALTDEKATFCGAYREYRPVPLKYQTELYKQNISKVIESLEESVRMKLTAIDCRYPGTFGRPFEAADGMEYKFIWGIYYMKQKDEYEWIQVKDQETKNKIDNLAKQKGYVKDQYQKIVFVN